MNSYDYLIVGLGISGSVLSRMLTERGRKVLVIDQNNKNSSSRVAAGLVNPVTGRRVVKSWMADELIPYSKGFYRTIENETGLHFYHECDVLEVVQTAKEVNDWSARMSEEGMSAYLGNDSPEELYIGKIVPFMKMFRIKSSGWMNIPVFIDQIRKDLVDRSAIVEEAFDSEQLQFTLTGVKYKDYTADRIIFCEGHKTLDNSLWNYLPFLPAKGEILTIHCKDLPENFILMSGIFIIPIGEKNFRTGSTYEWNFTHEDPTEEGKLKLSKLLDRFLKVTYECIDHRAGIRPTVKDRRPIIGKHPIHQKAFVFNGMGTKGVQLAPYFANHLIEHIENGKPLIDDVNVERWKSLFK